MAAKQAYKTKVQIAFVGSNYIEMESDKLEYIVIEHMYEERVMPVIYLSISVEVELYTTILQEKDSAKIFLRIQKFNAYSGTSLSKDYIKGQFTYFLPSATPEYSKDLADANSNIDSAYRTLTIGLMDMTIMNTLRKTFGGIVKQVDQHSLVYKAVEDTKIVLKAPEYNLQYENLYIPPMSSRKQMLDFIFSKDPFYDTEYLYFIDFNTSYLLDRSGVAVSANDGQLNDIIIDIKAVTMEEAYNEGMEERNGSYYFFVNPANTNVAMDVSSEKVSNQLVAGDESGTVKMDLNINRNTDSSTKQSFRRMGESSAIVYKNATESAQVCIELVKENIDSRYITPNKTFNISNYEGYTEYNGKYILLYKKEVIQGAANDFASIVTLGIKKLGNVQKIGLVSAISSQGRSATSSTTSKKSTYSSSNTTKNPSSGATTSSSK